MIFKSKSMPIRSARHTLMATMIAATLAACGDSDSPAAVESNVASSSASNNGNNGSGNTNGNGANRTEGNFNRIAVFTVCSQEPAGCDSDNPTAAEIVAASTDGLTLVYTNSPDRSIGFVDITDPGAPIGLGKLAMGGEPTSVAVKDGWALVGVNTSADYVNVAGALVVVDIATRTEVARIDLGGQPDSVAISPNGQFAAIAIENERDEDLGNGAPPQAPAGYLTIVGLQGQPSTWKTTPVDVTGTRALYPGDPEPEYVDINDDNTAVLSMQENNHLVLVHLPSGKITAEFTAGTVNLTDIDKTEEKPARILLTETQNQRLREPDGVSWITNKLFATANEGDLDGGSRSFSIFDTDGNVVFDSGNALEHQAVRVGHYPDARSGNKGTEPENVEFANFGNIPHLIVAEERSSLLAVYDVTDPAAPVFKQVLPTGVGPEGVLAIPSRNLLVAASEEDSRADAIRSVVNIYRYSDDAARYPTIASVDDANGRPIPWSALSGLAAGDSANTLVSIEDSFYGSNRIFAIDTGSKPARLSVAAEITDGNDVLAGLSVSALPDPNVAAADPTRADVFDQADLAAMITADKHVNLDPEGIAVASDGGFWIASEGAGTVGEAARPVNSVNLLIKTSRTGVIEKAVRLPAAVEALQVRFGFEGVAEYSGKVYVAFQRAWTGEQNPRIGIFDPVTDTWSFLFYPLDAPESPAGGWVGLSDMASLGDGRFLVVERDNQGGPDAAIKRLYVFDGNGLQDGATVSKSLVRDILPDLKALGGPVPEKIEGLAVTAGGDVFVVNDNDGVDDNSGETQLLNLGAILR
ncbi:MAG: esterase-like activity of phytase family protein [Burkholderiaceae bacterium]